MKCRDCEYAFEHLIGYGDYICDLDVKPIQLNQERLDCPLTTKPKHDPCPVCSSTIFSWDNTVEVMTRTCKACGHIQQVHAKEAA